MPAPFSIIRDTDPSPRGGVIAIGNFDGVHLGHRTVIDAAITMAKANGSAAYAVTFEPHPRSFFQPNVPQFRLSAERDKLRLLAATGLDGAVVMAFDAKRAATSAVDFITGELVGRLRRQRHRRRLRFPFRQGPRRLADAAAERRRAARDSGACRETPRGRTASRCRRARSATRSIKAMSIARPRCSATPGS